MAAFSLSKNDLVAGRCTSPATIRRSSTPPSRVHLHSGFLPGMCSIALHKLSICQAKKTLCLAVSAVSKELTGSITNVEGLRFAVVVWVPGSFEIPIVAQALAKTGKYHAVLCIGTVIRGETTHYDAVANSAASGVLSASLNSGVPCIFGVLTCETLDQALQRAGGKAGNKGAEAAVTAIEMASLFQHHLCKLT